MDSFHLKKRLRIVELKARKQSAVIVLDIFLTADLLTYNYGRIFTNGHLNSVHRLKRARLNMSFFLLKLASI